MRFLLRLWRRLFKPVAPRVYILPAGATLRFEGRVNCDMIIISDSVIPQKRFTR